MNSAAATIIVVNIVIVHVIFVWNTPPNPEDIEIPATHIPKMDKSRTVVPIDGPPLSFVKTDLATLVLSKI